MSAHTDARASEEAERPNREEGQGSPTPLTEYQRYRRGRLSRQSAQRGARIHYGGQGRNRSLAIPNVLPTRLDDPAIGIDDIGLAGVVNSAFSRIVGTSKAKSGAQTHRLGQMLALYGRIGIEQGGGNGDSLAHGALEGPWPMGRTSCRHLGLTFEHIFREWEEIAADEGPEAAFPVETTAAFFPPALWSVAADVVVLGPGVAAQRMRKMVLIESRREVPATRARTATNGEPITLSVASVRVMLDIFRRFLRTLVDLREEEHPHPSLGPWVSVPRAPAANAAPANTDRSAPSRSYLRAIWQGLQQEVDARLQTPQGSTEPEAVMALTESVVRKKGLFRLLRNRALLMLFVITGARLEALCALRFPDYDSRHRSPDGRVGPAIALRPGKSIDRREIRWKPLPVEAGLVIDAYLAVVRRHICLSFSSTGPLWLASPANPEAPLHYHSVQNKLSGQSAAAIARDGGTIPLLPREGSPETVGGRSPGPRQGYSPQTLRRAALQLARAGARRYCEEHELEMDPECISEVLLDHDVRADRYGYADVATPQGRERWAAVGAAVNWEMLTTARGARRVPDADAYRRALRRRSALLVELKDIRDGIDEAARLSEPPDVAEDMGSLLVLARSQMAAQRLFRDERVLTEELREVEKDLERLRYDPRRRIVLPDTAPESSAKVDLDAIEREEAAPVEEDRDPEPRLREPAWLTPGELAELLGVASSTVARWLRGHQLPGQRGSPERPWEPEEIPIDASLGPRQRRIPVAGIRADFIEAAVDARALERVLSAPPEGWSMDRARAPLRGEWPGR
jgi:integrase